MNKVIRKLLLGIPNNLLLPRHSGEQSQERLGELITSGEPFMAARFGAVEIKAMLYCLAPWPFNLSFRKWGTHDIGVNAGFFPVTKPALKRFTDLMLQSMDSLDLLASWRIEEIFFKKRLKRAYKAPLGIMGPILPPPQVYGLNI